MKLSEEKKAEVKRRLMARVTRGKGRKPCWTWKGTTAAKGIPICEVNGKRITVRRALYIVFRDKPPLGDRVLKSYCKNPECVNPFHAYRRRRQGKGGRTAKGKVQADFYERENLENETERNRGKLSGDDGET